MAIEVDRTAYFVLATFNSNPRELNGNVFGIDWENGIAGPFNKEYAEGQAFRIGGSVVEKTGTFVFDEHFAGEDGEAEEEVIVHEEEEVEEDVDELPEGVDEEPKDDVEQELLDIAENVDPHDYHQLKSYLARVRGQGVFDYLEYTEGAKDHDSMKRAFWYFTEDGND